MKRIRLCGPLSTTAGRKGIPVVSREENEDGRFTKTFACGCEFHGRKVTEGPLAGHSYGDGQEVRCDQHAEPEEEATHA